MNSLVPILAMEAKLYFRERAAWITAVLAPTVILVVLGLIPGLQAPSDTFGGRRFIDLFVPSLVVWTLATLGVNILPIRLTTYREKGILRRLSTTPVNPALLLIAQLIIIVVLAIVAVVLLVTVARFGFGVPLPGHLPGFIASFFLGLASLSALGLLAAALAPNARTGNALAMTIFFLTMFFGGVYVPRIFLPDFLQQVGAYTPPGVQALLDSWSGVAPQPAPLIIMAVVAVVAGILAARLFRWE